MSKDDEAMDEMYDKAADIAGKHLNAALDEGGELEYLVAVMMVEASVNAAVEATSRDDVIRLLRDLIEQIESDESDED
jgi:pantothenate kinase